MHHCAFVQDICARRNVYIFFANNLLIRHVVRHTLSSRRHHWDEISQHLQPTFWRCDSPCAHPRLFVTYRITRRLMWSPAFCSFYRWLCASTVAKRQTRNRLVLLSICNILLDPRPSQCHKRFCCDWELANLALAPRQTQVAYNSSRTKSFLAKC